MKHRLLPLPVAVVAFTLTFLLSPTHRTAPAHKSPEEREDNAREMFEWWYNQRAFPYELIPKGAFERAASASAMSWRIITATGRICLMPPAV